MDSYCDLTIGEDHLDIQGLWKENYEGFRPWQWPVLSKYHESFSIKIKEILENPDELICNALNIGEKIRYFPNTIKEFLGNEPESTSFRAFVHSSGKGLRSRARAPGRC